MRIDKKIREAKKLGINLSKPAALVAFARGDIKNALVAGTPGGIEAQEAAGQQALVNSQQLPKDHLLEHREQLEKLGFVFGEEIDDVFVEVALPDGWTKEPTDHNMWSDLLDEQGRKRAGIFYKAAFYDRSGHMDWHSRYSIRLILADGSDPYRTEPDEHGFHRHVLNDNEEIDIHAAVIDGNAEIHRTEPLRATIRDYDVEGKLRDSACEWLDANRPNWSDPFLSWDN